MKLFGKQISKQVKRDLISRFIMIALSFAVIVAFAVTSVAWFATNQMLTSTGMKVVVDAGTFEIMVNRAAEYDRVSGFDHYCPYTSGDFTRYRIEAVESESGRYVSCESGEATVTLGSSYYRPFVPNTDDGLTRYNVVVRQSGDGGYIACDPAQATVTIEKEVYAGTAALKDYLFNSGAHTAVKGITDTQTPAVAFEMINDYERDEDGTYYLMPGAYGSVTFYIVPKSKQKENGTEYKFTFSVGELYYEAPDITEHVCDPNATADEQETQAGQIQSHDNILKGHILFFDSSDDANGDGTPDRYGDQILPDSEFTYTAVDGDWESNVVGANGGYKITIYWVWPLTYDIIRENSAGGKYPSSVTDFVSEHPEYFFDCDTDDFESADNDDLNDMYNDCDQTIGDSFDFLVLYMTASKA
ncbi:MAG: hypothetical protein ILP02_02620 [Clostridia bacterium]|nr:hypothetical protein [Clostridia bacterium]